jgi:DNA-binding transcriptional regulator YdaS (Cro superfamily)
MKLMEYLKTHDINEVAKRAKTTPGYLKLVAYGHKTPGWPRATNRIIIATGGEVTTRDLRPDIVEELLSNPDLRKELESHKIA